MKITAEQVAMWASNAFVLLAKCQVSRSKGCLCQHQYIELRMNPNGVVSVRMGETILYRGGSLEAGVRTFNEYAEEVVE